MADQRDDTAVMHDSSVKAEGREFGRVIAAYSEIPLSRQQLVLSAMTTIDDDGVSRVSLIIETPVDWK